MAPSGLIALARSDRMIWTHLDNGIRIVSRAFSAVWIAADSRNIG